jgi:MFS family permease
LLYHSYVFVGIRSTKMQTRPYFVLLGGLCASIACGSLNCWGMILPYLASYYRSFDTSTTMSTISSAYSYMVLIEGVVWLCNVYVLKQAGIKLTVGLGVGLIALASFSSCFITNPYLFVAFYSFSFGIGISLALLPSITAVAAAFPNNRGVVSGVCSAGFGFAPMLYTLISAYACNPDNVPPTILGNEGSFKYFDKEVYGRVPFTMAIIGCVNLSFAVIAVLCLSAPKKTVIVVPNDDEEVQYLLPDEVKSEKFEPSLLEIMRTSRFWKLCLLMWTGMSYSIWIFVCYKSFGAFYIQDDAFLNLVGVVGSISNGISRFVFPALMDYVSYKSLNLVALSVQTALCFTVYYSVSNDYCFLVVVALSFFVNGSQFFPQAVACNIIYGKHGPKTFSLIAWGCVLASFAPVVYYEVLVNNFGFESSFILMGLMSLAAILINSTMEFHPEWPDVSQFISFRD